MTNKTVPEPPRFNSKPSEWESWVQKMELKLRSTTFNCLEEGLLYVLGFLTNNAYQLVNPRVPSTYGGAKMDLFTSIDEMLCELKEHYTNRNESGQAWSHFAKLSQGDKEKFTPFYVKYQKLAYHVTRSMPVEGQAQTLLSKMNQRYSEKLNDGHDYTTLNALTKRCHALENGFADADSRFTTTAQNGGRGFGRGNITGAGNSTYTPSTSANTSTKVLPAKFRNMAPWSEAERIRCDDNHLCRRCRQPGHRMQELEKCELKNWTNYQISAALTGKTVNTSATAAATVNPVGSSEQGNGSVGP
jgi:hypothetical protein